MICPSCFKVCTDIQPFCENCGADLSPSSTPLSTENQTFNTADPQDSPIHKPQGCLVTRVLRALAFLLLVKLLFFAGTLVKEHQRKKLKKRNEINFINNQNDLMASMSMISFSVLADSGKYKVALGIEDDFHYWANGSTTFRDDLEMPEVDGYEFHYFSNSDVDESATKFIIVAYPEEYFEGQHVYLTDDNRTMVEFIPTEEELETFSTNFGTGGSNINWEGSWEDEKGYTRLKNADKWTNSYETLMEDEPDE